MGNGPSILDYFNPNHEDMINRGQAGLAGKDDAKAPFDLAAIGDAGADLADFVPPVNVVTRGAQLVTDIVTGNEKQKAYHAGMLAIDLASDIAIVSTLGADTPAVEAGIVAERLALREGLEVTAVVAGDGAVVAEETAAKTMPRLVPWGKGGKVITGMQVIHAVTDCDSLGKLTPVVSQSCQLKKWQEQNENKNPKLPNKGGTLSKNRKQDEEDRKKDAKKELKQKQGYEALKGILTGHYTLPPVPAPVTPAPHTDDAPMQVHNKPEVTVDPDFDVAPHFARPSAADLHHDLAPDVAPELGPSAVDLRGPAAIVLAGVVIYTAYSVYAVA